MPKLPGNTPGQHALHITLSAPKTGFAHRTSFPSFSVSRDLPCRLSPATHRSSRLTFLSQVQLELLGIISFSIRLEAYGLSAQASILPPSDRKFPPLSFAPQELPIVR